MEEIIVNKRRH